MFALKQPAALRERLEQLQRDKKLGKITKAQAQQQGLEVLIALRRLGDTVPPAPESCPLGLPSVCPSTAALRLSITAPRHHSCRRMRANLFRST